jgi:hypothetical protein
VLPLRRLFALHAAFGVMVAVAPARAQMPSAPGAVGEMPLPGGLPAALAALDDRAAPDRSQFLLDFIRRFYDAPIRVKSDPRDSALRALLAHLGRSNQHADGPTELAPASGPSTASRTDDGPKADPIQPDTLPLPLPAAIWTDVVFHGRATPQTLVASIAASRGASLLYYGLLSLDDATRAWLATQPQLIADLTERHPAAFASAAPGLRVEKDAVRVPGGEAAEPGWQALVGRRATEPAEFLRALVASDGGRLAYFFGTVSQLTPAQIRFAMNLDAPSAADRVTAARGLYGAFGSLGPGWNIEDRAFWRPGLDPVLLAADLRVDDAGRPVLPGTRRFWSAIFARAAGSAAAAAEAGGARALAEGDPVDFAWLSAQVFRGPAAGHRRRYRAVLFASRTVAGITPDTARDVFDAVRAVSDYPALGAVLERARITDVGVLAAAARRADRLASMGDGGRAVRALAQFQGGLAVLTRAALRGSLPDVELSAAVASLCAIEPGDRGDYEGRLVRWLAGWTDRGRREPSAPPPAASLDPPADWDIARVYEDAPGPLDENLLRMLSGPPALAPRFVNWEGTRYRFDLSWAEARRLALRLGERPRPYLSSAHALVQMADALADTGLRRETLVREAGVLDQVTQVLGWDGPRLPADAPGKYRQVASALAVARRGADVGRAARLAPQLRLLADELLARGLTELTYAVSLGQPEGALVSAAEAARRHEFGLGADSFQAWHFPSAATDTTSGRGWRVAGSLLGLDVKLAELSLVRLSSRLPSTTPTLQDLNRRVLVEAVALVEPRLLTETDRDTLVAAVRKGRARLAAARTPAHGVGLAEEIRLGPARRTLLRWVLAHDPERAATFLAPSELFWLGLGNGRMDASLHAWGAPAEPRLGCLCLRLMDPGPIEILNGRWSYGMLASAFPDLNLRLAELLAELKMPAALLGPVLTSATLHFIDTATSRDSDDRRGLLEFVHALRADRIEQYLALLTTDGPLVPVGEAAEAPVAGGAGSNGGVQR